MVSELPVLMHTVYDIAYSKYFHCIHLLASVLYILIFPGVHCQLWISQLDVIHKIISDSEDIAHQMYVVAYAIHEIHQ